MKKNVTIKDGWKVLFAGLCMFSIKLIVVFQFFF